MKYEDDWWPVPHYIHHEWTFHWYNFWWEVCDYLIRTGLIDLKRQYSLG